MPDAVQREATYEDLLNVPDNMVAEILDGELTVAPRPARRHVHTVSALGARITVPNQFGEAGGPGGWIIYYEPEIHFGEKNIVVPDLAGWRKERLDTPPEEHRFTVPPDWICEVLSPATAQNDRIKKVRIFARYQVPYVWLIDPILRTLEVLWLESGKWVLLDTFSENDTVRAEPFLETEFHLDILWLT